MTSKITIITLFMGLLISCSENNNLSSFYFPVQELGDGQVYRYTPVTHQELGPEDWFYKSIPSGSDTVLVGQAYNDQGAVEQLVVERLVDLGVVQDSLILYHQNDGISIPIPCTVGPGSVFPFYRKKDDTLKYKAVWTDPTDSLTYTLEKKKVFSHDTLFLFQQKEWPAVSFTTFEEVETFREDMGMTQSSWQGEVIYAEGLGLVYYRKEISPDFVKAYRLSHRFDMESYLQLLPDTNSLVR